jgi:MFS family permease
MQKQRLRGAAAQAPNSGWRALFSGTYAVSLLTLAGGVALHAANVFIATTILPSVVAEIGGIDYYAWNTTLFVAASILGSALSARLLQRVGPRHAYVIASFLFAAGAAICALAPSMAVLLAGRLVQGLGGGLLFSLSYAMIRLLFEEALWPRAMALVSGMWGVATLVGPAIGGLFAELELWRGAFWSLVPMTLLFAGLAATVLPKGEREAGARTPLPRTQLVCLTAAVLAVSAGSTSPNLVQNVAGIVVAGGLTAVLVGAESRARHRLLPNAACNPASALAALYAIIALLGAAVTSSEIFVPLFLQVLHRQSPLVAGYLAALMAAGWTLGSLASSGAAGAGAGRTLLAGPLLSFACMVVLAMLLPEAADGRWAVLVPISVALAGIGFGVGLAWPHLLVGVFRVVPAEEQALGSASVTTVQLFAAALGAALAGMVANLAGLSEPGGVAGTASAARWLFAVFALCPLLCLPIARRLARGAVRGASLSPGPWVPEG